MFNPQSRLDELLEKSSPASKPGSLPWELWYIIIDLISASQIDFDHLDSYYRPDRRLRVLARTCPTLYKYCVPKLYAICNTRSNRVLAVLRTLANRKALAKQVKRIIIDEEFSMPRFYEPGIIISAKEAARYNSILELNMNIKERLSEVQDTRGRHLLCNENVIGKLLAYATLALLPNLTSALFVGYDMSLGYFKPGSFPHLETLVVGSGHFRRSRRTWRNAVGDVLLAGPNAAQLVGVGLTLNPFVTCCSVRQLALINNRIAYQRLVRLPEMFPNLEQFTYWDCKEKDGPSRHQPYARAISEVLLGMGRTLKQVCFFTDRQTFDVRHMFMESLAPMKVLEHLRMQLHYISASDGSGGVQQLADFLPESLQSLHLVDVRAKSRILALAESAPEKLPKLAHVNLSGLDKSLQEEVRQSYEWYGMKCSFEETVYSGSRISELFEFA